MNQTLFKFQNNNINVLGSKEKPMFFASQVASILGYSNTKKAVYIHIWEQNKMNILEYNNQFLGTQNGAPSKNQSSNHPNKRSWIISVNIRF